MPTIGSVESGAWTLTPTALIIASVTSILFYITYLWLLPKPIPGIPYNKDSAKRILGDIPRLNALAEAGDAPRMLWTIAAPELRSPIAQVFLGPTNKPIVIVSDYREINDLQLRSAKALARGWFNQGLWRGLIPEHFIAMENYDAGYKDAKGLGKDLMTPKFLHEVNAPAAHVRLNDFIVMWREKMRIANGCSFDAFEDLGLLTYDIILAAGAGLDTNESGATQELRRLQSVGAQSTQSTDEVYTFPETEKPVLQDMMEGFGHAATTAMTAASPKLYHFLHNLTPSMRKRFQLKKQFMQGFVDQASKRLAEEGDSFRPRSAVDYMVSREVAAAEKAGRQPDLQRTSLRDNLLGYLVGGQDSTHATLSFLVKYLGEEQEAQEKLRAALFKAYPDARANNEEPKLEDILKTKVPYLDAFVEEVLRCKNPSLAVSKQALEDLTILGHHIPKGTMLVFATYGPTFNSAGMQVDESVRSESSQKHREVPGDWSGSSFPVDEFHPERWLKVSEEGDLEFDPKAGPMLSFSSGPRMCWGRRLAYLELRLVVTAFVWNFLFEKLPAHLHDWDIRDDLFLKARHSRVKLRSVPRAEKV